MTESLPLEKLYPKIMGKKTICIMGGSEQLAEEIRLYRPYKDSTVIVLNSAFMAFPEYDIHLIANLEFMKLYGNDLTKKGIAIKVNSYEPTGYEEEYFYFPSKQIIGESRLTELNDTLVASWSVLVPALHFALRCKPEKIILYGIDMRNALHWDDGKHENVSMHKFPGMKKVIKHVGMLTGFFPEVPVYCINNLSVLVRFKAVRKFSNGVWRQTYAN